jgi:hypothetical protein
MRIREGSRCPWEGTYHCTNKVDEVVLEGLALQASKVGSTDITTSLTTLLLEEFEVWNTWDAP